MTPIRGETKDGLKTTIRSADLLPETVIYDVDLTMTLPPGLSAVSGMNAIARSVEALYARDRNPIISLMAQESIRALADALPKITINPGNVEGRTEALTVPGSRESALAPSIWPCITSSVTRSADRSTFHTLKPIPSFCRTPSPTTLPPQWTPFAGFSAWKTPLLAFTRLQGNLASPQALSQIGMPEEGIDRAAEITMKNAYWNPRPLERDGIRDLIRRAHLGQPPKTAQSLP